MVVLEKGRPITGSARDKLAADLARDYDGGASVRSIATSIGRSYGFVYRLLTDYGVALRPRGGPGRR